MQTLMDRERMSWFFCDGLARDKAHIFSNQNQQQTVHEIFLQQFLNLFCNFVGEK